ncbi:FtsK/SpoIIIE domain-containing protein [Streptomyces sp. NPDC051018]|uniref:FtsK/SpoIIIE domain-containing protein n=1 Tax=Streptomyces sp. NPDC051018 TaxID=3365639 RepID=UPI0037915876
MQIRLTVLAPRGGQPAPAGQGLGGPAFAGRACDVLVTAPPGTALSAVASALATAVAGPDASGAVVLYAGRERLDAQRRTLGEPPLVDGAVLSLHVPGFTGFSGSPGSPDEEDPSGAHASAQLHVVAGPDAGGVHLLHGGRIAVGRSADADVPLDDPDVSRAHCAVTVAEDGGITVADLGSTNGTTLDGRAVGSRPVGLPRGALLRLGESTLRIAPGEHPPRLATAPDGEGHLRVRVTGTAAQEGSPAAGARFPGAPPTTVGTASTDVRVPGGASVPGRGASDPEAARIRHGVSGHGDGPASGLGPVPPGTGASGPGLPPGGPGREKALTEPGRVPPQYAPEGQPAPHAREGSPSPYGPGGSTSPYDPRDPYGPDRAPSPYEPGRADSAYGPGTASYGVGRDSGTYGRGGTGWTGGGDPSETTHARAADGRDTDTSRGADAEHAGETGGTAGTGEAGELGALGDSGAPGRRGGGRENARRRGIGAWARRFKGDREEPGERPAAAPEPPAVPPVPPPAESWPDPAAVLLTALGPGRRLWERGPAHPESLVLRLGTTDRDGLSSVPVTVGLREAGSLGLAGPRARLAGAARWALAQLAALHSPADLEIVLISTDRARGLDERRAEWSWLGWLPHLRPGHGQDCRLLLAYDREQAAARAAELTRRLDDGPLGPGWPSADRTALSGAAARYAGPRTVVVVDGDPGSAALRETTARLASAGWAAGIHLIVLAETSSASPLSPVAATYESACAVSLAFRECGAVGMLSGEVATALRVLRTAGGLPAGHGALAALDAVSAAWAERFGRALAPLRTEGGSPGPGRAAPLPRSARLLDELGLARATPASLMARWAATAEPDRSAAGPVVLGAGPGAPLAVDLASDGPHLLIEGPPGSGRTELLRSVAASLAAAGRPDRLGLLLVDGAGGERGEGLAVCTELPHVTDHLVASDPVRMREFAQALGAELKRRAELLGRLGFAQWHTSREVAERMVAPRPVSAAEQGPGAGPSSRGDLDSPPSGTLRLRPGSRTRTAIVPEPLPRLVVLVDDFDALVAPALGSTGRPAAGSVVRALEAVARDGERLGVHLVAASARPDRTADTELARGSRLRVVLDAPPVPAGPEDPLPGRGELIGPDGRTTPFQGGRVTGRIPRTATLRPTVVPLEWERMGDPPTRRPVRELGNGPTDLALLASALERAARSVDAVPPPPLAPGHA